jgi:hypothetical protein
VAVSVWFTTTVTGTVIAWKLPVLAPAGMFTVAGIGTRLLGVKATFIPPVGATVDRPIVQRVELPPTTEDGTQANDEIVTAPGGVSVMDVACEEPL